MYTLRYTTGTRKNTSGEVVPKPPASATYSPDPSARRHARQDGGGRGRGSLNRPGTPRAPRRNALTKGQDPEAQVS